MQPYKKTQVLSHNFKLNTIQQIKLITMAGIVDKNNKLYMAAGIVAFVGILGAGMYMARKNGYCPCMSKKKDDKKKN